MSTLRVDKIKSRTGSVVEVPDSHTLAVTGVCSVTSSGKLEVAGNQLVSGVSTISGDQVVSGSQNVAGNQKISGVSTVSGTLNLTSGANLNNPTGIITTGTLNVQGNTNFQSVVGSATTDFFITRGLTVGGISTYSGLVDINSNLDVSGNVTIGGALTYEDVTNVDSVGMITARGGLNIIGESRFGSVTEKLKRINGNTATIDFITDGANIGFCTNPTGNITLNVTGIPTTNFDNKVITFSLFIDNTGANAAGVRTCTAVKLNNLTKTIRWQGGTPTPGVGNTSSYDVFSFTGINTIGSGTTTANYEVLGIVNGNYAVY